MVTIHKNPLNPIGKVAARSLNHSDYMSKGPDYLLYAIVDGITDEYFPILDRIRVRIDELEDEMYEHRMEEITEEFMALKRSIILIRKVIMPQKRIFAHLNGLWTFEVNEENIPYFIDLIDHLERIVDSTETYRDLVNSALDTYYSIVSAKTTEIMRVLTIISTIMMPLTFITGIFGMNVKIPYEEHPLSIVVIVLGMIFLAVTMLYAFKKRKWL